MTDIANMTETEREERLLELFSRITDDNAMRESTVHHNSMSYDEDETIEINPNKNNNLKNNNTPVLKLKKNGGG